MPDVRVSLHWQEFQICPTSCVTWLKGSEPRELRRCAHFVGQDESRAWISHPWYGSLSTKPHPHHVPLSYQELEQDTRGTSGPGELYDD